MERCSQPQPGEDPAPPLPALDENLYVIHYSQELAEGCTAATPAVSAIVVQHALTDHQKTFAALHVSERSGISPSDFLARHPELERKFLEDFYAFAGDLPGATWLHWGMRKPWFGFEVLSQRAHRHGLVPREIPPEHRFDLANYLKRRYGCDYVPHPRLWHAIHRNGLEHAGLLSETQTAAAWSGGNHAAVLRSLSCKVNAITRIFERVRTGTFLTGEIGPTSTADEEQGLEAVRSPMTAAELADALRRAGRKGKPLPAALVEIMTDRQSAPVELIADKVHGDCNADCKRIQANVRRTNKALESLAAAFRFKVSGGRVHKIPAGSTGDASGISDS